MSELPSKPSREELEIENIDRQIHDLEQRLFVLRCMKIDWQREVWEIGAEA